MHILGDEGHPYPWHGVGTKPPQDLDVTVTTTQEDHILVNARLFQAKVLKAASYQYKHIP